MYVSGGVGPAYSVAAQGKRRAAVGHSVVVGSAEFAERRVKAELSLNETLPNAFYGLAEAQGVSVTLDNSDGAYTFLAKEEARGKLVRVRRYDESTGELIKVFEGIIDSYSVGDEVQLQAVSQDLTILDTVLPKNRVVSHDQLITSTSLRDVEAIFPKAKDISVPINIVLGRAKHVPLIYVAEDRDSILQRFDFLVCEEIADIEQVYKVFDGKRIPAFSVDARVSNYGLLGTEYLLSLIDPISINLPEDTFPDTYVVVTGSAGDSRRIGSQQRIVSYNATSNTFTLAGPLAGGAQYGDIVTIREWGLLPGDVYPGRTAVRFHNPLIVDQSQSMTAYVARYRQPQRNLCRWTEHLWNPNYWTHDLNHFGNPLPDSDKVESPNRENTALRLDSTVHGTAWQRVTKPSGATGTYTFSCWARVQSAGPTLQMMCNEKTSGDIVTIRKLGTVTPTTSWVRYAVTYSGYSDDLEIGLRTVGGAIDIWGTQIEIGPQAMSYEPVAGVNQSFRWSIPEAMKEILSNPVWGLSQPIREPAFAQAIVDLDPYFLRTGGSIPSIDGTAGTAKEILEELAQMRGIRLGKKGSAWSIEVDKPKTSVATFGMEGTPWTNIKEMSPITRTTLTNMVKTLRIRYGGDISAATQQPVYPFLIDYKLNDKELGQLREIILRFAGDGNTADRGGQYIKNRLVLDENRSTIVIGEEGRTLKLSDVITVVAPRRQPENRLKYSEDMSISPWVVTGTATKNIGIDPERRSRSATLLASGTLVKQTTVDTGQQAFGRVWLKAVSTPTSATVRIRVGGLEKVLVVPVGSGWKEIGPLHADGTPYLMVWGPGTGLNTADLEVEATGGQPILAWGAQVTFDYPKPYLRTTDAAYPPTLTWQVAAIGRTDLATSSCDIIPYDSTALFAYSPAPLSSDPDEEQDTDPRTVPPDPPGDFVVPHSPPTVTAAAGVDMGPEGITDSWGIVSWAMPARCVRVTVQRKKGDAYRWEDCGSVTTNEVPIGQTAELEIRQFTPGLEYSLRAVAINSVGLSHASETLSFVAWGDTYAPDPPFSVTVVQGTGRLVNITVRLTDRHPDLIPIDFDHVNLYRTTTEVTDNTHAVTSRDHNSFDRIENAAKFVFHDMSVLYGEKYYYWVEIVDKTGNASAYYPTGAGIPVSHMVDGTIVDTDGEIHRIDSTEELTTLIVGTIEVTGPEGTGADSIKIWAQPGSEINFVNSAGLSIGTINVIDSGSTGAISIDPSFPNICYFFLGGSRPWRELTIRGNHVEINADPSGLGGLNDGFLQLIADTIELPGQICVENIQTGAPGGSISKYINVYQIIAGTVTLVGKIPLYV